MEQIQVVTSQLLFIDGAELIGLQPRTQRRHLSVCAANRNFGLACPSTAQRRHLCVRAVN